MMPLVILGFQPHLDRILRSRLQVMFTTHPRGEDKDTPSPEYHSSSAGNSQSSP